MGSDLFDSYAEASCAALFVASISSFRVDHNFGAMMYPLLISSMGIVVCISTTFYASEFLVIEHANQIEPALKKHLFISTAVMTVGILIVTYLALPFSFTVFNFGIQMKVQNW